MTMKWTLWVLCIATALLQVNQSHAQASLAAENIIDSVIFEYTDATGSKQKTDVTVVRDAREVNQWYYIPSTPVLVSSTVGGAPLPVFSLVKYDYADPTNAQTIKRAGLLNFSVRLSLPAEALEALKAALIQKVRDRNGQISAANVRIGALPINSATVSLFAGDGKLTGTAEGTGIAPTFASQHMAFSVPLTDVGTAVFDALISTPAGLRVAVQYKYNGLTPPAGFKVKLNYRNAFEHYSKNEQFRATASYYGLFNASASSEKTNIREQLVASGAMTIEIIDSANFPMERVDAYLQPILKRINDQVLENQKPPDRIDPAKAAGGSAGGVFGGASYSVAVKEVSLVKDLIEEIDFRQQSIVERATVASGFVGIANYPESVRKQLVTTVDGVLFPSAYIAFPDVPRGISRVDMDVSLMAEGEVFARRSYLYGRENGWKDLASGQVADRIGFSLAAIESKFGKSALKNSKFSISKTVRSGEETISFVDTASASVAAQAVELSGNVSGLRIKASQVPFQQMGGDVKRISVTVKHANKEKVYEFEAVNVNSTWQPPPEEFFFLPTTAAGSSATVLVTVARADPSKNTSKTQSVKIVKGLRSFALDEYLEK